MTTETNTCCSPVSNNTYVSRVSYSHTRIKTQFTFSGIHNEMMQPPAVHRASKMREKAIQQHIQASLPDIRDFLKPWYFHNARQHNHDIISRAAADHVNRPGVQGTVSYEVTFKQLSYMNSPLSRHMGHSCGCANQNHSHSGDKALSDSLTDDDKHKLEAMHKHAESEGGETTVVDHVAREVVSERIFSQEFKRPVLDLNYFDKMIAKMQQQHHYWDNIPQLKRLRDVLTC